MSTTIDQNRQRHLEHRERMMRRDEPVFSPTFNAVALGAAAGGGALWGLGSAVGTGPATSAMHLGEALRIVDRADDMASAQPALERAGRGWVGTRVDWGILGSSEGSSLYPISKRTQRIIESAAGASSLDGAADILRAKLGPLDKMATSGGIVRAVGKGVATLGAIGLGASILSS